MKKALTIAIIMIITASILYGICGQCNIVYAEGENKAIDDATESKLVELKQNEMKTLEDYKEKYGSDTYGVVAYILNIVRIYSIPFCILGIALSAVLRYIIGIRKLDTQEKGMKVMVSFITLLIICQILPLAFAVFVKFGR